MSTDAPKTPAKPRAKNPSYDVYREHDDGDLALVMADVHAPSRRAAIVQAVAGEPEEGQYGTFATVKHGELKTDTRGRKTEPTDVWS